MSGLDRYWPTVFLVKGLYNILSAIGVSILGDHALNLLGPNGTNTAYPDILLCMIFSIGVGYLLVWQNIRGHAGIVLVGFLGQLGSSFIVVWQYALGNVFLPGLFLAFVDFVFALIFGVFLWRYFRVGPDNFPIR